MFIGSSCSTKVSEWGNGSDSRNRCRGVSSREGRVGAGMSTRCGWFGYFPLGVVSEVVFVIGEGDRDEGELELFGEPTRGSRDSGEDFVVVVRGEC